MRRTPWPPTLVLACLCAWLCASAALPAQALDVTAFVDVTVVPMDRERVLEHQTVLVRGERIAEIGPVDGIEVPGGARRIDGQGRFLMPGLVDMHVHLAGNRPFQPADQMLVLLANGVTTVRGMVGTRSHIGLREAVRKGTMLGPTIYAGSPVLIGLEVGPDFPAIVVKTVQEARDAVRQIKADGYDHVKVHFGLTPLPYAAIVEAAQEVGLAVTGHVTDEVGLWRALEAGQQIEHLDGYLLAILAGDAPPLGPQGQFPAQKALDLVDETKIPRVARATLEAGVWNTPTLALFGLMLDPSQTPAVLSQQPEMRYVPKQVIHEWTMRRRRTLAEPRSQEYVARYRVLRNMVTKALYDAGAKLMAGSDSPQEFVLHGFGLHRELRALQAAGLPPFAVLQTATANPAEFLRANGEFGTVSRRARADLLLLRANPLADVANAQAIDGVMVRGRWLARGLLQKRLDALAESLNE